MFKTLASFLPLLTFAGCSLASGVDRGAVEYNKTFEETGNQLLLLNVFRARDNMPLYFSRYSAINGSLTVGATASTSAQLSLSQGSRLLDYVLSPNLNLTGSSSPSFAIDNLDTDTVYKGILKPISPETFIYYWETGFPKELLTALLIENMTLTLEDGSSCFLDNYPPDQSKYQKFNEVIYEFTKGSPSIVKKPGTPVDIGPPVPANLPGTLEGLIEAHKAELDAHPVRGGIQLSTTPFQYTLKYDDNKNVQIETDDGSKFRTTSNRASSERCELYSSQYIADTTQNAAIRLRSVQAVIYYLGELARVQTAVHQQNRYTPTVTIDKKAEAIFYVVQGNPGLPIHVNYRGTTYGLPEGPDGLRSRQALSLLKELFSLHLDGTELPRSQTVLVAN